MLCLHMLHQQVHLVIRGMTLPEGSVMKLARCRIIVHSLSDMKLA